MWDYNETMSYTVHIRECRAFFPFAEKVEAVGRNEQLAKVAPDVTIVRVTAFYCAPLRFGQGLLKFSTYLHGQITTPQ